MSRGLDISSMRLHLGGPIVMTYLTNLTGISFDIILESKFKSIQTYKIDFEFEVCIYLYIYTLSS